MYTRAFVKKEHNVEHKGRTNSLPASLLLSVFTGTTDLRKAGGLGSPFGTALQTLPQKPLNPFLSLRPEMCFHCNRQRYFIPCFHAQGSTSLSVWLGILKRCGRRGALRGEANARAPAENTRTQRQEGRGRELTQGLSKEGNVLLQLHETLTASFL